MAVDAQSWWIGDTDELAYERLISLGRRRQGLTFPEGVVAYGEHADGGPVFTIEHRRSRSFHWLAEPAIPWASVVLRARAGRDVELADILAKATLQAMLVHGERGQRSNFTHGRGGRSRT